MEKTYTLTLDWGRGYDGSAGKKCWVARITGTDPHYGLAREFLEADDVKKEHFGRRRTNITFGYSLPPSLYEQSERGEREFFLVWLKNGEAVATTITAERATAVARLLDEGQDFEATRKATLPAAA